MSSHRGSEVQNDGKLIRLSGENKNNNNISPKASAKNPLADNFLSKMSGEGNLNNLAVSQ